VRGSFDGRWIGGSVSGGLGHVLYALVLAGLAVAWCSVSGRKSVAAIGVLTTPFVFALVPFASTRRRSGWGTPATFYWFTPVRRADARRAGPEGRGHRRARGLRDHHDPVGFSRLEVYDYKIGVATARQRHPQCSERDGRTTAFASFWISGRLTYESSERITAVATDIGPTGQMLEDKVRTSTLPAYVFFADDPFGGLETLRQRAADIGAHLKEIPVDGKFVVAEPTAR